MREEEVEREREREREYVKSVYTDELFVYVCIDDGCVTLPECLLGNL